MDPSQHPDDDPILAALQLLEPKTIGLAAAVRKRLKAISDLRDKKVPWGPIAEVFRANSFPDATADAVRVAFNREIHKAPRASQRNRRPPPTPPSPSNDPPPRSDPLPGSQERGPRLLKSRY